MDLSQELVFIVGCLIQIVRAQSDLAALLSGNGLFGGATGLGSLASMSGMMAMPGMEGMGGVLSGALSGALSGGLSGGGGSQSGSCPHKPHSNPLKYTQIVNDRLITMDCAPGTMFDGTACSCVNLPKSGSQAGSNPRLSMGGPPNPRGAAAQPGTNPRLETAMAILAGRQARTTDPVINSLIQKLQTQGVPAGGSNIRQAPISRQSVQRQTGRSGQLQRMARAHLPDQQNSQRSSVPQTRRQHSRSRSSAARLPSNRGRATNPQRQPTRASPTMNHSNGLPSVVMDMLKRAQGPPSTAASSPRRFPSPTPTMRSRRPQSRLPQVSPTRRQPTRGTPKSPSLSRRPTHIPPTLPSPRRQLQAQVPASRRGSAGPDPMADLLAQLSRKQNSPGLRHSQDPMKDLLGGLMPPRSQSRAGPAGSPDMAALLASLGGGGGAPSPLGGAGAGDISALLAGLTGGQGAPSPSSGSASSLLGPGGALDVTSLAGNHRVATLLGETPGPELMRSVDMTQLFNLQGQMRGVGAGLAGFGHINAAKLEQLDRQGVIDIGDLTPAGLVAANAHFAARG